MLDVVVIGAGHAGLAASRRLADAGLDHVVLERGEVGESWRAQRWDSFALNTPNRMNRLPGAGPDASDPDAFEPRDAWTARLDRYAETHGLPVRRHTTVVRVERDGEAFLVSREPGDPIRARNVIVAAGLINVPRIPAIADGLDRRVGRLTAGTYRRPDTLEPGAVLVVGSAQSGCQIAEDLLDHGREVYLATGTVGRLPRRMRGRDTLVWMTETGWMDERPADLPDPAMMRMPQPQISGVGPRGRTVSLQSLAARGVQLLGRLAGVDGATLGFGSDLAAHVRFADEMSRRMRADVDRHIAAAGLDAPPSDPDPADEPASDPEAFTGPAELDLVDRGISTVIFTTGFNADLSWLRVPTLDERGAPIHDEGRSPVDGLWFLGVPWMRQRKSGNIWGAMDDSAHVAGQIVRRSSGSAARR
ncbi:MAG: putative flavoprotein involved in transport [Chloroflexota bacterium]|nr:putative flavoprotein involved in transport [Chloroflexota bacterium]